MPLRTARAVTISAEVGGLADAQRVLTVLTGRAGRVTRFAVAETAAGRWRVTFDLVADADGAGLVLARLERMPAVRAAEVLSRGDVPVPC